MKKCVLNVCMYKCTPVCLLYMGLLIACVCFFCVAPGQAYIAESPEAVLPVLCRVCRRTGKGIARAGGLRKGKGGAYHRHHLLLHSCHHSTPISLI